MKKKVKMDKEELIEEHEHLVKVLKKPTKKKLAKEASKQSKELAGYKRSNALKMLKRGMQGKSK